MDARYYRFLFQNTNDAVYYSGSLWNTYEDERFHFLYISANTEHVVRRMEHDSRFAKDNYPLDLLVLSDMNARYLEWVVRILYQRPVHKVVMPYFSPACREELMVRYAKQMVLTREMQLFLADPYEYLLEAGVEHIYFLHGNGPVYDKSEELDGDYFGQIDEKEKKRIVQQEGSEVPVYTAGYMIWDNWLFYFGNYGRRTESTVMLYHGSILEDPEEEDCTLYIRTFSKNQDCSTFMESKEISCGLLCNYRSDFDCLKKHNRRGVKEYVNGTLLLGNVKIKGQVEQIYERFYMVKEKVRFISLPNGGSIKNWDKRILGFGKEHYKKYWIGPSNDGTSPGVIKDICISSPYNQYMMTDEFFGVCMTGFMKNRADIVLPELND